MKDEPAYTEEQVLEMRDQTERFIALVNQYLHERKKAEPLLPCWEVDLEIDDETTLVWEYGDELTIQWKEWDRCGGYDYMHRSFPLSDLWTKEVD